MTNKWPEGMEEFVRSNAWGVGNQEMADKVNEKFGTSFTREQLKSYKRARKISSGLDGRFKPGRVSHNKGKKMSPEQYEKCKATMFKKGEKAHNYTPVGTISKTTDGYAIIKISDEGIQHDRWQFLHRKIWEEHNGPIPPGFQIVFIDGDRTNLDIENLAMVDNEEKLNIVRHNLKGTDTGVILAKLITANSRRKRGK